MRSMCDRSWMLLVSASALPFSHIGVCLWRGLRRVPFFIWISCCTQLTKYWDFVLPATTPTTMGVDFTVVRWPMVSFRCTKFRRNTGPHIVQWDLSFLPTSSENLLWSWLWKLLDACDKVICSLWMLEQWAAWDMCKYFERQPLMPILVTATPLLNCIQGDRKIAIGFISSIGFLL